MDLDQELFQQRKKLTKKFDRVGTEEQPPHIPLLYSRASQNRNTVLYCSLHIGVRVSVAPNIELDEFNLTQ